MRRRLLALTLLALVPAFACTQEPREGEAPHEGTRHGTSSQEIVGGSADTTHPAVVSLSLKLSPTTSASCAGTGVRVSGTTGMIVTSAHCYVGFAGPASDIGIRFGPNSATPTSSFVASSFELFPTTQGGLYDNEHDLAVVTFNGASGATPLLPIVPPATYATYAKGAPFVSVGYGRVDPDGSIANTARNKLSVTLEAFAGGWVETKSAVGSTCKGDSGGALIDSSSGADRLAGVTQGGASATFCNAGSLNFAVGFYPPETATWLRAKGLAAPDGTQPNGADCTTDAMCASTACVHKGIVNDAGTIVGARDVCDAPLQNGYVCQRADQCASAYCAGAGGCQACNSASQCSASKPVCSQGKCTAAIVGSDAGVTTGGDAGGTPKDAAAVPSTDAGGTTSTTPDASAASGGSSVSGAPLPVTGAPDPGGSTTQSDAVPTRTDDGGGCRAAPNSAALKDAVAMMLGVALMTRRRRRR
ncbi:MAG: trypsin-like peptidase domain-containing protein [Myxococcales bacterium]|nr:trypsin-like peptidase domain-containing protein [Myxococcales bacterium]